MKTALRNKIRLLKATLTPEQRRALSAEIIDRLMATEAVKRARTIMMYHPLDDEPDTQGALDILRDEGKIVLLPHVVNDTDMTLRVYTCREDLTTGAFGIQEPPACGQSQGWRAATTVRPYYGQPQGGTLHRPIDVAVVPGVAFDHRGNRLGRGRGYYDRLLSHMNGTYKIGLCFPFQIVDHVPTTDTDIKMDLVVS